jgi:hypothetical protein
VSVVLQLLQLLAANMLALGCSALPMLCVQQPDHGACGSVVKFAASGGRQTPCTFVAPILCFREVGGSRQHLLPSGCGC